MSSELSLDDLATEIVKVERTLRSKGPTYFFVGYQALYDLGFEVEKSHHAVARLEVELWEKLSLAEERNVYLYEARQFTNQFSMKDVSYFLLMDCLMLAVMRDDHSLRRLAAKARSWRGRKLYHSEILRSFLVECEVLLRSEGDGEVIVAHYPVRRGAAQE